MAFPIKLALSKKHIKKSSIVIPCMFTLANALCGFLSIIESIDGCFMKAACLIGIAVGLDLCDGRLARALGKESDLGIQLDSLCDAISFCIAPIMLLYNFFDFSITSLGVVALGSYLCAGLLRLARFNTTCKNQNPSYFTGMPTPVAALFLVCYVLYYPWLTTYASWSCSYPFMCTVIISLAVLMISTVKFFTFKTIRITKKQGIFISSLCCIIASMCFYYHLPLLLIGLLSYCVLVVVVNCYEWTKRLQILKVLIDRIL